MRVKFEEAVEWSDYLKTSVVLRMTLVAQRRFDLIRSLEAFLAWVTRWVDCRRDVNMTAQMS